MALASEISKPNPLQESHTYSKVTLFINSWHHFNLNHLTLENILEVQYIWKKIDEKNLSK